MKLKHEQCYHDFLTEEDRSLIDDIVSAYEETGINAPKPWTLVSARHALNIRLEIFTRL